jgi:hypothetical protein
MATVVRLLHYILWQILQKIERNKRVERHNIFVKILSKDFLLYSITPRTVQHGQHVSEFLTKHGYFSKTHNGVIKIYGFTILKRKSNPNGFYSQKVTRTTVSMLKELMKLVNLWTFKAEKLMKPNSQINELYLQT